MKKAIVLTTILQLFVLVNFAQVKVQYLLTENLTNPIGLDVTQPRFSWKLVADSRRDVMQSAYEIMVSSPKGNVWKSGKVMSDSSVHVAYKGAALQSGTKYAWEIRVWDNSSDKPSAWSEPAFFQTALLNASDWKAKWITPGYVEDSVMRPSPYFRKQFDAKKK